MLPGAITLPQVHTKTFQIEKDHGPFIESFKKLYENYLKKVGGEKEKN